MAPSEDARDGAVPENPSGQPIVLRSVLPGDRSRRASVSSGTASNRTGSTRGPSGGTVLVSGG